MKNIVTRHRDSKLRFEQSVLVLLPVQSMMSLPPIRRRLVILTTTSKETRLHKGPTLFTVTDGPINEDVEQIFGLTNSRKVGSYIKDGFHAQFVTSFSPNKTNQYLSDDGWTLVDTKTGDDIEWTWKKLEISSAKTQF